MGCGPSSEIKSINPTVVPSNASSSTNDPDRIKSATSETCSTVLKSPIGEKKSITPSLHSQDDAKHDLVIIWADPHIDNTINEKNVALIVSDAFGEQLVPTVFDKPKLQSIYIFSQEKEKQ
ncbi:unnamed protein product, partial [Rotaria sp. Silwood1]